MRQVTDHLLDPQTSIAVDDPLVWKQLEDVLQWWMTTSVPPLSLGNVHDRRRDDAHDRSILPTEAEEEEGVRLCIRLLDRLAALLPKEDLLFVSILPTELLNRVLARWRAAVLRQLERQIHRHQASSPRGTVPSRDGQQSQNRNHAAPSGASLSWWLSPSGMAGRLEAYRWSALVQPDARSFNLLLHAMARVEGVHVADQYLRSLLQAAAQQEMAMQQATGIVPGDRPSEPQERHLQQQQQQQLQQELPLPPMADMVSVNTVIKGWVDARRPEMAQQWLDRVVELGRPVPNSSSAPTSVTLRPDAIAYNTVIYGWAQEGNVRQAERVLQQQVEDWYQNGNHSARPDRTSFHAVLDAWVNATKTTTTSVPTTKASPVPDGKPRRQGDGGERCSLTVQERENAPARARSLIQQMQDLHDMMEVGASRTDDYDDDDDDDDYDDDESFPSKGPDRGDGRSGGSCSMLLPNMETMSKVIVILAQSSWENPTDAANMLLAAENEFGERAATITYNRILHAYAQRGLPELAEAFLMDRLVARQSQNHPNDFDPNRAVVLTGPDTISFNCVMDAWANVAKYRPDAAWKCEEWLRTMEQAEHGVPPSAHSYAIVLNAWSVSTRHCEDAADRAEEIFRTMLTKVRDAHREQETTGMTARSGGEIAATSRTTTTAWGPSCFVAPDYFDAEGIGVCFNTVLKAWDNQATTFRQQNNDVAGSRRAGARAMSLFHDFVEQRVPHLALPPPLLRGDRRPWSRQTFRAALHIVAGSGHAKNKHKRASDVLTLMRGCGIEPTRQDLQLVDRLANKKR
jgi:pentatricopeptide repeat protein